jgi:hypothetical protein
LKAISLIHDSVLVSGLFAMLQQPFWVQATRGGALSHRAHSTAVSIGKDIAQGAQKDWKIMLDLACKGFRAAAVIADLVCPELRPDP